MIFSQIKDIEAERREATKIERKLIQVEKNYHQLQQTYEGGHMRRSWRLTKS